MIPRSITGKLHRSGCWLATAGALLLSTSAVAPVLAHHSFAMFDADKCVSLSGTVQKFDWTFPHSWLWLMVTDTEGKDQVWGFEGLPPAQLVRETGWQQSWLQVGDKVTVMFNPLRNGQPGGAYVRLQFGDGRVVTTMANHAEPCDHLQPSPAPGKS